MDNSVFIGARPGDRYISTLSQFHVHVHYDANYIHVHACIHVDLFYVFFFLK